MPSVVAAKSGVSTPLSRDAVSGGQTTAPLCETPIVGKLAGNIDFLGKGVNALALNTFSFELRDISAPFRNDVIDINYYAADDSCTNPPAAGNPNVFVEPAGATIDNLQACSSSFSSQTTKTVREYVDTNSVSVGVSGAGAKKKLSGFFQVRIQLNVPVSLQSSRHAKFIQCCTDVRGWSWGMALTVTMLVCMPKHLRYTANQCFNLVYIDRGTWCSCQ